METIKQANVTILYMHWMEYFTAIKNVYQDYVITWEFFILYKKSHYKYGYFVVIVFSF